MPTKAQSSKAPSKPKAEKPDAAEAFSKRLTELEDRIAAIERALGAQLGLTV